MIRAILIDDEKNSLESLEYEVETYCDEVEVVGAYRDPRAGREAILEVCPDLVFLDIEMPNMDGFELLQSLPEITFDIIFVTAYDQFAIKAFEFNAIDYLLKPVRKSKLVQAVQKIQERQHGQTNLDLDALISNLKVQIGAGLENIALPTGDGFEFVHVNEISHLTAESNYTWVFLSNKKKFLVAKTLKDMAAMIQFPQFFRAHKSHVVNLNHVARYVRGQGGYLVLRDETQIPVSRTQKDNLMRVLKA